MQLLRDDVVDMESHIRSIEIKVRGGGGGVVCAWELVSVSVSMCANE